MNGTLLSGLRCQATTRRPASANGSGRSSTASTTLKTAVLAPMPRARTATATTTSIGRLRSDRSAYRTSWARPFTPLSSRRGA